MGLLAVIYRRHVFGAEPPLFSNAHRGWIGGKHRAGSVERRRITKGEVGHENHTDPENGLREHLLIGD